MGTDIAIPEIKLIEKLEEMEITLSPAIWQQFKNQVTISTPSENFPSPTQKKRHWLISDFVNKAISQPLEIIPKLSQDVEKQLYRLHLFCCQQAVHNPEIRHNPLILGYRALEEMHMALVGILVSYRLIHPECPYSWSEKTLNQSLLTHKGPDGHSIVKFPTFLPTEILNAAITEEMITDWLIYRAHDNNGIRTLMDIKNNLLDLPNFQRGGNPCAEFSRFERKLQEKRNKKQEIQTDALELELRKTIVQSVAQEAVAQMIASGMSTTELLNQAINGDLKKLTENLTMQPQKLTEKKEKNDKKKLIAKKKQDTAEIETIIAGLLETEN